MIKTGVALALLLGASMAYSAGLGKLTVNSALGQPLNAEIDLVSLQPGELESLTARVAPPEAFRDARIEYSSALRLLRFSVEKRANGTSYIKVTSIGPINEPFLDALIEVTWPQGRIQREYPILLDPPGYSATAVTAPTVAAAAPAAAAPSAPAAAAPSAPDTPPAPAPAASSPPSAPVAAAPASPEPAPAGETGSPSARAEMASSGAAPAPAGAGDSYGPVQRGDTLRKIAEEVKPSSVSLEQMLVALYRENKSAFIGENMNRLKAGQILKVPSAEDVSKIENREANREYRTHVADWRSYREQLAGGVAAAPARPGTGGAATGQIASAAVAPPAAPVAEPKDVLKLSRTEAAGKGAPGKGGSAAQVTALQEELTAKDKALREAQSRVADLEKQIRDMQRLLDLKAGVPGKTDPKVAAAPPPPVAPAKTEPAKVEPPKPAEPAKVEPVKPGEPAKAPDTKLAGIEPAKPGEPPKPPEGTAPAEVAKTAPPKAEPPKVADAKPAAPKAPPKKAPPPPPPKSFTEELLDNPAYLAAGVGGLALLGLGAFLFIRRRRQAAEDGPSSAMTSAFPSDLKADSTTGKPAAGLVDTGNSSFLTDFDKTGPGTIDTDEVDPVAEAEVYIAYGRDAQAEEILKEAMARDRSRPEIALKLLEIYHARKSATAFETVARELHGQVGENDALWLKAAAMGAQIDPSNPLYAAAGSGTATFVASTPTPPAAKPELDFDIEGSSSGQSQAAAPAPDFNLDSEPAKEESAPPALDFDLEGGKPAEQKPAPAAAAEPKKEEKPAFDFDLSGLDFPGTSKAEPAKSDLDLDTPSKSGSSTPSLDLADLNLESPAEGGGAGADGVGTKLELAKAYLEIGDKDGAREILQEVAKEGTSAQKEEAQRLIASL